MSDTFKPADLGAVVARIVLELLTEPCPSRAWRDAAVETVAACRQLAASYDADNPMRPCALWWSAALELAVAFSLDEAARLPFVERASSDIRAGGYLLETLGTMYADVEPKDSGEAAFAYAPLLPLFWRAFDGLLTPERRISQAGTIALTAISQEVPKLEAAARMVYTRLKSEHPTVSTSETDELLTRYTGFRDGRLLAEARQALDHRDSARFEQALDSAIYALSDTARPDLVGVAPTNTMRNLAVLTATSGWNVARRSTERIVEALAVAANAHLAVDSVGGPVRHEPVFDMLFNRAARAGVLGRGYRYGLAQVAIDEDALGNRHCVWIHERDSSLDSLIVAWRAPGRSPTSFATSLSATASGALRELSNGRPGRLTSVVLDELGERILGPIVDISGPPDSLVVIASPTLRNLPFEALTAGGMALLPNEASLAVAASLGVWAELPQPQAIPVPFQFIGVFDRDLAGAVNELDTLRRLGRSGVLDGVGVTGPAKLAEQLARRAASVLAVSVHAVVTPAGLVLNMPSAATSGVHFLQWWVPPTVILAACRSADVGPLERGIDLPTVCLRQGATSVVASRWPISDAAAARVLESVYNAIGDGGQTIASALRMASNSEREVGAPIWTWASFMVIGRSD